MPFFCYMMFVALYLGVQMFQGLSYLDIGFYMSGYLHFTDEPLVSYYLGQWLMTFVMSSALGKVFGITSYMGFRVLHLVFVLLSQTVVYFYLKRYIRKRYIFLGLILATFSHFGGYTEINYNDYSIGLLTLAVMAYHTAVLRNRKRFVFLSGVFVGLAIFFRLTNLTFIGLPFAALLISFRYKAELSWLGQAVSFFVGVAAGTAVTVSIVYILGMSDVVLMTLKDITGMITRHDDPHTAMSVVMNYYRIFKEELKCGAIMALLTLLLVVVLAGRWRYKKLMAIIVPLVVMVNIYFWEPSANITVGICLMALVVLFVADNLKSEVAWLFLLSLYVPIVFPLGSNAEVEFYGKDVCFLSLPLALTVIANIGCLQPSALRPSYFKALILSYVSICIAFLATNIKRTMMEDGNRLQCRYMIESPVARGIYTTKENADMHNYLLKKLKPMIPNGSYLICDFSIPIIEMLGCKPFAVFSTRFTSNSMSSHYISVAYNETGKLPFLLMDRENRNDKDRYVEQCLSAIKPYRVLWHDDRFVLKCPLENFK